MTDSAAMVRNARMDYLGSNRLGHALFAPMFDGPARGYSARFAFLDRQAMDFYPAWDRSAAEVVGILRVEAGWTSTAADPAEERQR